MTFLDPLKLISPVIPSQFFSRFVVVTQAPAKGEGEEVPTCHSPCGYVIFMGGSDASINET